MAGIRGRSPDPAESLYFPIQAYLSPPRYLKTSVPRHARIDPGRHCRRAVGGRARRRAAHEPVLGKELPRPSKRRENLRVVDEPRLLVQSVRQLLPSEVRDGAPDTDQALVQPCPPELWMRLRLLADK